MPTPMQSTTSPYPTECVDGLHEVTRRLQQQLDVTIVCRDDVPVDDIGWWDSPTNTVTVRADATPEQQVWLLIQVWQMLVLDPAATAGHTEQIPPRLQLVADPAP